MPESTPVPRARRPKVVYVMGAGKSGSTIVGVTLGNCAGFFYAGELDKWLVGYGVPAVGGPERTRFWNEVRRRMEGVGDLFGARAQQSLERISSLVRVDRWSTRRGLRGRYLEVTAELYDTVAATAQAQYVIDSSHLPLRAHLLQELGDIELYVIFLVRDRQSIVASHLRHVGRHDVAERRLLRVRTNVNLWLTYLLSTLVFMRQPRDRRLLLRYEDFVREPELVLRDVLDRLGSTATELPDLDALEIGMPLQGNRLIRAQTASLKREVPAPYSASRLTRMVQAPWTLVLGRLRPVAGAGSHVTARPAARSAGSPAQDMEVSSRGV